MSEGVGKKNKILARIRRETTNGIHIENIKVYVTTSLANLIKVEISRDNQIARSDLDGESEEILDVLKRVFGCEVEIVNDDALQGEEFKVTVTHGTSS